MKNIRLLFTLLAAAIFISSCNSDSDDSKENGDNETSPEEIQKEIKRTKLEAIDLGLSVDWASCNIGATTPTEFGGQYSWGDATGLNSYGYIKEAPDDISGTKYDIVSSNFGKGWRMPTKKEYQELLDNCNYELTIMSGVKGYLFTGKTGKTVFFPLAGRTSDNTRKYWNSENVGLYWTANSFSDNARIACFFNGLYKSVFTNIELGLHRFSVRGVIAHNSSTSDDSSASIYEKPDVAYYDFTAYPTKLKVVYKIWNNDKAKVTSAKIYYGTTSNPTKYVSASVSSALITGYISGLTKGTTYYVKCVDTGKGGATTTTTTKLATQY